MASEAHALLWAATHHKPFRPFEIRMTDGESLKILRRFACAVMPKQFAVEAPGGHIKFYPLERVRQVVELQEA